MIRRAVKRAQIPAIKEMAGLFGCDGKCPDEVTLIHWAKGKPMAQDVTIPDTFTESHLSSTATDQEVAAKQVAENKIVKYRELENRHLFPSCY